MGDQKVPLVPGYALVRVWAAAANVPLKVCEDARLRGSTFSNPRGEHTDQTYGESGNDWGIGFSSFRNLVDKLKTSKAPKFLCGNSFFDCDPIPKGYLKVLKVNAHGAPGFVDIEGKSTSFSGVVDPNLKIDGLEVATLPKYKYEFNVLNELLHPNADLIFMCCMTAQSARGTEFLTEVSKLVPGRDVIGFATIGYSDGAKQIRHGEGCAECGMRDTSNVWASTSPSVETARYKDIWNDLGQLPWASPSSPHAKMARDGKLTGGKGKNL